MRATYLDSSAVVKLIVAEPESAALRTHLRRRRPLVSCALARTEVLRALLPVGEIALSRAHEVLRRLDLVRINDRVLDAAGILQPAQVRSFDAIHLATAQLLGEDLGQVITYDERMAEAARSLGLKTIAPG
jgi:predicted nucleic acid-binding protein